MELDMFIYMMNDAKEKVVSIKKSRHKYEHYNNHVREDKIKKCMSFKATELSYRNIGHRIIFRSLQMYSRK